jgi:hypothetical protein
LSTGHSIVALLVFTGLGLATTGAAAQSRQAAAARCDAPLPLVWIDGGQASPAVLLEAQRETSRIWARAGVAFEWTRSTPDRSVGADEVLVVLRDHLAAPPRAGLRVSRRRTLGRVIRGSADRPGRLIELAMPVVAASVLHERLFGRLIGDLPEVARDVAVGRGLGRVLAHEIGHWLFGSEHSASGLMRASIERRALVGLTAPALPAAWPSLARDRLHARRVCAQPCPVRQPVTQEGTVSCR